ncbi:3'-5' exonuclease [Xanthobacter sp. VTT E-85241]|uniref:3'-5' exonuclease n=1 Tax=Roseixanthobacter finlandensis TaxID=3119922 RepID=UPI00372BF8EC
MSSGWDDAQRTAEGRPDSEADAVSLITMHSAKGLEWPVVIPINTISAPPATEGAIPDRAAGIFTGKAFGIAAPPYAAIHADEVAEREREQMRLWYVATTRAMDFLFVGEVGHVEEMPFGAASDERRLG